MLSVLLLEVLLLSHVCVAEKRLVSSIVVFRHGNRTASETFRNNPYKGWDEILGTLTNEGKRVEYDLGIALKKRFWFQYQLINEYYVSSEVTIVSAPQDRCLRSAEVVAAGMFPPIGEDIWNENLLWNPIPIHTTKSGDDYLLENNHVYCPLLRRLKREVSKSKEFVVLEEKYKDFLDYASRKAGENYTLERIFMLNDAITTQYDNKKPLPPWATRKFRAKLKEVTFAQEELFFYSQNPQLKRLSGGYLLYVIAQNMKNTAEEGDRKSRTFVSYEQKANEKLILYSTHDYMIIQLMNVLGIPYYDFVPFGAALSIELYQDSELGHIVEVHMRNDAVGFRAVPLERCPHPCNLDSFMTSFKDQFVTDMRKECFQKGIAREIYFNGNMSRTLLLKPPRKLMLMNHRIMQTV